MRGYTLTYRVPAGIWAETPQHADHLIELSAIPGVTLQAEGNTELVCSSSAFVLVASLLVQWGVPIVSSKQKFTYPVLPKLEEPSTWPLAPPEGDALLDFQVEGVKALYPRRGGLLWWDTGLGKSLGAAVLVALWAKYDKANRIVLVVKTDTIIQWISVIKRWTPHQRAVALYGDSDYEIVRRKPRGGEEQFVLRRTDPESGVTSDVETYKPSAYEERAAKLVEEYHTAVAKYQEARVAQAIGTPPGVEVPPLVEPIAPLNAIGLAQAAAKAEKAQRDRFIDVTVGDQPTVLLVGWGSIIERSNALTNWRAQTVVFDEVQSAKSKKRWKVTYRQDKEEPDFNRNANFASSADKIGRKTARNVLELTATPAGDRPRDWWALLDMIDPRSFGAQFNFAARYCAGHQGPFGHDDSGSSCEEELKFRVSFLHHRAEKHKLKLPPLTRLWTVLPPARQEKVGLTREEAKRLKFMSKADRRPYMLELAARAKHSYIVHRAVGHMELGLKVVIFGGDLAEIDRLAKDLDTAWHRKRESGTSGSRGATPPIWIATGEATDPAERRQLVLDYGAVEGPACVIGTIPAIGVGIDGLQVTDKVIVGRLPDNHGALVQLEGRFSRVGGDVPCEIEVIHAEHTYDDKQVLNLQNKTDMASALDEGKALGAVREFLNHEADEEALIEALVAGLTGGRK